MPERIPAPSTLRLFVALWPTPAARRDVAAVQATLPWPAGSRPVAVDGLHLTLAFIGAVPREQLIRVGRAAAVPSVSTQLVLDRLEVWQGGTAVLCPSAAPPALLDLQARLAESLQAAAVPFDARPFRPHLTLARKTRGMQPMPMAPLRWRTSGHVLVLSAGGRYTVLARYG